MKKFKFKFETLKNVREHKKKIQQQKLARAEKKKMQIEHDIRQLEESVAVSNQQRNQELTNYNAAKHRQHYSYLHDNYKQIQSLNNQLNKVNGEVEKERKKLIQLSKKTKILENLEARQRTAYLEEMDRMEQKQLNEVAIQQYNWQRR